ncbi:OmpA family protein [Cellulomonas wangsupingiae]|uniref:OmpA family protein n=1 Tax=Cellulomonas wangsupingiae TaxID=2968085 RepID=A0ABY5K678_9CELL|nr:OmpA family protein [Cellulomonas wangsupingiae]MCC2334041.1 OmpA family protein [Cellulomonas wangsupingiae]UUI65289.1 OmpA family protein [Cellulomonas wangsupingiae]
MLAAPRTRRARTPLGVALVTTLALLTACTGGDPGVPDPTPTPSVDPGPQPEDVVATAVVADGGIDVEIAVHPVVRVGEHAVLTLDLTPLEEVPQDDPVHIGGFDGGLARNLTLRAPSNVRLVDLVRDVVYHPGIGADEWPVVAPDDWDVLRGPEGSRVLIPYAAPPQDVSSVSVFLPGAPLVADVPVIEGDVPSSERAEASEAAAASASAEATGTATPSPLPEPETLDLDAIVTAPTFPLDSTSAELEGAVTTTESTERIDVQLGSDVLFEFDQATLTPAASEAIALVAARISEREPGTVSVVGHTDDQGDDAYNQDLSQRRAQAVADVLGTQVDGAAYPMEVDGRGEAEPFVANDSEENRARNRRVTVTLTSTVVTRTDVTTTGELPPFGDKGQVAPGDGPVKLANFARKWEVQATARRVHGHVVVDLAVRGDDQEDGMGWTPGFLRGWNSHRGDGTTTPVDLAGRAVLLHGASKLYPMDYTTGPRPDHPGGEWLTVTDLDAKAWIDGGQTRVYSFVYPRMDVDTVTFQVGTGIAFDNDFRLVDVPVAPGDAATTAAEPAD